MVIKKYFWLMIIGVLLLARSVLAITAAGTPISNTAICTYQDEKGFSYTITSNTIVISVAPVYNILITPDDQSVVANTGGYVAIPFILKNTGNTTDTYSLYVKNLVGDSGDLLSPTIYIDTNNNGVLDSGEPIYDNNNPPKLSMGEVLHLLVYGQVPVNLASGTIKIEINGFSNGDNSKTDNHNIATITIQNKGFIKITKNVDKSQAFPGENLTFTISFSNPGSSPVYGTTVQTDFDNDGYPEGRNGVLIEDKIPDNTTFVSVDSFAPVNAKILYKGNNDSYWKNDISKIKGSIKYIALFFEDSGNGTLVADQEGYLKFTVKIDTFAPSGYINNVSFANYKDSSISSNETSLYILPAVKVIADDTDDNGAYTGNGTWDDPDDLMVVDSAATDNWIEFRNEVWNLGNTADVINISFDPSHSLNVPKDAKVVFYTLDGVPLTDTNGDGLIDVGEVQPGQRVEFITKVYLPPKIGGYENVIFGIKAISSKNPDKTDLTFDKINKADNATVIVKTLVQTQTQIERIPLKKEKVIVYEYDSSNKVVRKQIFWTDDGGYILYDEKGNRVPIYDWMRDGYKYSLTLVNEYNGFTYYLTSKFEKNYFNSVTNPGEQKCWDVNGNELSCDNSSAVIKITVNNDGTELLEIPLDPAGYVYDGMTGAKINGACVTFYRCSDESCNSYSKVDPALLDFYPDGITPQENPQVSGPMSNNGTNVSVWDGGFQFKFKNFNSTLEGWYFVEVDFDCSFSTSDPSLKDKYSPIKLKKGEIWKPTDGKPYTGEKFYINAAFPGAILMRIPLLPSDFKSLQVEKSVSPSTASIGDFVKWTIKVKNPNKNYTVYDISVFDNLPRGLRYRNGTTRVNGLKGDDPVISSDGQTLRWHFDKLEPEQEVEITFYTLLTPGVTEGKNKNIAYAQGWSDTLHSIRIDSNTAFAYLQITKGVFTDKAYIIGKVFIDDNDNGVQDENEKGVKGVKIYMEDGRFVITDSEGKYHFDNVNPGTHVLKVDKITLPPNTQLKVVSNRNMGDPDSCFADVFPGDIFKVNFRLVPEKVNVKTDLKEHFLSGNVKVERYIDNILVDPTTKEIVIVNALKIENKSKEPLYEIFYTENSPYEPLKGTSYLNNAPYDDPEKKGENFSYRIPLISGEEIVILKWNSKLPENSKDASANLSFSVKPFEDLNQKFPINIPIVIKATKPKVYELTVYFDFGSYELSDEAKESLRKFAEYLRKSDYEWIYIKVTGHTDTVRVTPNEKDYKTNMELSLKRAEIVKDYLKNLLIDINKVKIEQ